MFKAPLKNLARVINDAKKRITRVVPEMESQTKPIKKKVATKGLLKSRIIWVDLELTGLDVENDRIMEIACIVTESNLDIVGNEFEIVVHQPKEVLDKMDDWCIRHHGDSGLTEACINSIITLEEADKQLIQFVKKNTVPDKCCVAGNTVYMDRWFIAKRLPLFHEYLHYRLIDVSSIKELCKRWNPELYGNKPKKKLNHRALDDIKESIEELKYYKNNFFNTDR